MARYNGNVAAGNFRTPTVNNVPVDINEAGTTNIKLDVGTSSTAVEVTGAAPPVDTSTAQLQTTYTERMSQDLGLTSAGGNGGGVLNLSMLSPGVTNASAMGLGAGPSVGGQRPRAHNFTVVGGDNKNKVGNRFFSTAP